MPQIAREDKLESRSARLRLAYRHAPYWRNINIQEGQAIGCRRASAGRAGRWQARFLDRDGNEKRVWRLASLGTADDLLDADGIDNLSFAQAHDKAPPAGWDMAEMARAMRMLKIYRDKKGANILFGHDRQQFDAVTAEVSIT